MFCLRVLKIIAVNFLILLLLLLVVEVIGGNWFTTNPMGAFNIPQSKTVYFDPSPLYPNRGEMIQYSRDAYGLRGTCLSELSNVDVLTLGGSTTDQRYITDTATWQEVLQKAWKAKGQSLCIANAGIDGHSTFGHIEAIEKWLLPLKDLRPKYLLFYVGLNDVYLENETEYDRRFQKTTGPDWKQKSFIYSSLRNWLNDAAVSTNQLGHGGADLDHLTYTSNGLLTAQERETLLLGKTEAYRARLEKLVTQTREMGAEPVFISQPSFRYRVLDSLQIEGVEMIEEKWGVQCNGMDFFHLHQAMNSVLETVANSSECTYIDISMCSIWEPVDFYDFMHMTPKGASKLGRAIAQKWVPE